MKNTFIIFLIFSNTLSAQILNFENMSNMQPGDTISTLYFNNTACNVKFYSGFNIRTTQPLTYQRIAHNSGNGGFIGVHSDMDCMGNKVRKNPMNQVNTKMYAANPSITNRQRIGCHFISCFLRGDSIASVFIEYETGTQACSGDLLDVDGDANSIEAYDVYYYETTADYPANPINKKPLEIRAVGKRFGAGIIGDNGGVLPFKIESKTVFRLIELRPISKVDPKNAPRKVYGFALDNFSPCQLEEYESLTKSESIPTTVPSETLKNELAIYFDSDQANLSPKAKKELNVLISDLKNTPTKNIIINGYTDPNGTNQNNKTLAQKRINAVLNYLKNNGVNPTQISTKNWGETFKTTGSVNNWEKRKVLITLDK